MYLMDFFADAGSEILGCVRCRDTQPFATPLKMAFQPIVNTETHTVFAYEALVRGANGASAGEVLNAVQPENLYAFDQTCRVLAIDTAQRLGMETYLSINFLPNSVYEPATCIRLTVAAAQKVGFPTDRLIF